MPRIPERERLPKKPQNPKTHTINRTMLVCAKGGALHVKGIFLKPSKSVSISNNTIVDTTIACTAAIFQSQ